MRLHPRSRSTQEEKEHEKEQEIDCNGADGTEECAGPANPLEIWQNLYLEHVSPLETSTGQCGLPKAGRHHHWWVRDAGEEVLLYVCLGSGGGEVILKDTSYLSICMPQYHFSK
jgi:hypothetical protein